MGSSPALTYKPPGSSKQVCPRSFSLSTQSCRTAASPCAVWVKGRCPLYARPLPKTLFGDHSTRPVTHRVSLRNVKRNEMRQAPRWGLQDLGSRPGLSGFVRHLRGRSGSLRPNCLPVCEAGLTPFHGASSKSSWAREIADGRSLGACSKSSASWQSQSPAITGLLPDSELTSAQLSPSPTTSPSC